MVLQGPTELERESLEAHVDLCALRYGQLDNRLSVLEKKMDQVQEQIIESQKSLKTVLITSAATIVAGILTVVVTLLMKF